MTILKKKKDQAFLTHSQRYGQFELSARQAPNHALLGAMGEDHNLLTSADAIGAYLRWLQGSAFKGKGLLLVYLSE